MWHSLLTHLQEPKLSFEEARKICLKTIVNSADFNCIQLVYGYAGKHFGMRLYMYTVYMYVQDHMTCHMIVRWWKDSLHQVTVGANGWLDHHRSQRSIHTSQSHLEAPFPPTWKEKLCHLLQLHYAPSRSKRVQYTDFSHCMLILFFAWVRIYSLVYQSLHVLFSTYAH